MAETLNPHPVRTQILDLCLLAFNQDGYKNVSMDLVARQLKISKKTIYKHFNSKEEILEEVLKTRLKKMEQKVDRAFGKKYSLSDLALLASLYFEFIQSLSGSLLMEIRTDLPHLSSWIGLSEKQAFRDRFRKMARSLRKEGIIFYSLSSKELTEGIFTHLRGIQELSQDLRSAMFNLILKGLAKEQSAKRKAEKPGKVKKEAKKKR